MIRTVIKRLDEPVDASSLAAFRIAFGGMMFMSILRYAYKGWISDLLINPKYHFTYPGFEWIEPWPKDGMYYHFAFLGALSLMIMLGLASRICAFLFFLAFTYVELLDRALYLNHYYLISILSLLMVFLPLDSAFSLQNAFFKKSPTKSVVPLWVIYLLRFQIGIVYIYAGLAKLRPDWLFEAEPLHGWLSIHTDLPLIGAWMDDAWLAYLASFLGALFDLSIVPLLLWKRTRLFAYFLVVAFHTITGLLLPIGIFPWVMISLTPIFFSSNWPKQLLYKITKKGYFLKSEKKLSEPTNHTYLSKAKKAFLILHVILQVVLPLRQFLYPGDTLWTEEGFRFAWNVMLVRKRGHVDFYVAKASNPSERWIVDSREELTYLQRSMMSTQADMILTYAHRLGDIWSKRLNEPVHVYADARVSMNGKPSKQLIRPNINLLDSEFNFKKMNFISRNQP